MLKVKNKRMLMKKGAALVLASVLFVSSSKVAYADGTESYISSIEEGLKANDFSKVTNNILKDIVNTTNSKIALSDIDIALKSDSNNDHFIAQGISAFAQEQKKIKFKDAYEMSQYDPYLYINYDIDEISVFDNLTGKISSLPRQICLLTKITDFGSYSLYELHANTPCYVITDASGKILTYSGGSNYYDLNSKNKYAVSFKEFLKSNGYVYDENYSYLDLFEGFTFDFSEHMCQYTPSSNYKISDVLVIDVETPVTTGSNMSQDYYFIKYVCPNLFIEGENIYKDVENTNAKITVDEENTLSYYDAYNDTSIYDIDMRYVGEGYPSSSALVRLKDFAEEKDFKIGFSVSYYELKEFSEYVNPKNKTLGITCK